MTKLTAFAHQKKLLAHAGTITTARDHMNSKQRRRHHRVLERQHGHALTVQLCTARLLGQKHVRLVTSMPDMWSIPYVAVNRYEVLRRIAAYGRTRP